MTTEGVEAQNPRVRIVLKVADADAFNADPAVEMVTLFEDAHYGTREMTVRNPNGHIWSLPALRKN